jgi:hypothetical protein
VAVVVRRRRRARARARAHWRHSDTFLLLAGLNTFGERSLEGDVSTSSLRRPVGAGSGGGAMVKFSVLQDGVGGSAKRELVF